MLTLVMRSKLVRVLWQCAELAWCVGIDKRELSVSQCQCWSHLNQHFRCVKQWPYMELFISEKTLPRYPCFPFKSCHSFSAYLVRLCRNNSLKRKQIGPLDHCLKLEKTECFQSVQDPIMMAFVKEECWACCHIIRNSFFRKIFQLQGYSLATKYFHKWI